jgi:hypothetical protein
MNSLASAPSLAQYSASPYSTSPYGSPYSPNGYGSNGYYMDPTGYTLQGLASLTKAEGKYWGDIQEARIGREKVRQVALETERKRVEFEHWYDGTRPTAPQLRERETAADLDRARKDPPATEVWSGKALNDLLRSIQSSGTSLGGGANVSLEEDTLKQSNLSYHGSQGNIGMLKDNGTLAWPKSLKEPVFDEQRNRLSRNLRRAVADLKGKGPVEPALLNDIKNDLKALDAKLGDSAAELSASQYIKAKRYLNQLAPAVKALSDPKVGNYFNNTWNARGKNVAELVANMSREGLVFAAAAPGEEAAYNALYQALRSFEASVRGTHPESSMRR